MAVLFSRRACLALLCLHAVVVCVSRTRHTYDAPRAARNWRRGHDRASPSAQITLFFMMRQSNVEQLLEAFHAVSDPSNLKYGKHLSNEEVNLLTAPSDYALRETERYIHNFTHQNIYSSTPNRDMLEVTVSVHAAEQILNCEYYVYTHTRTGETMLRTSGYSLPESIAPFVAAVAPTVFLPNYDASRPKKSVGRPEQLVNVPSTLRTLYGVNLTQGQSSQHKMAVTGFIGQLYSKSDFSQFKKLFLNATQMGYNVTTSQLKCVGDDGSPSFLGGTEAMLDAEYITALGANISTEFWGFKGNGNDPGLWMKWMAKVANTSDESVPKVFSVSYGEDEDTMPTDYADRVNVEFVKAGARGISILFASGDSGAANQNSKCPAKKFVPKWPAASPYITCVGGTGGIVGTIEAAADLSSGGFSNRYKRPKWQAEAVEKYLSSKKITKRTREYINNTNGRGFPDVSAQAIDFMVVADFIPMPVMGTSCASPTFAGIVGLLNSDRAVAGKPPLGFLNPLLYQNADALNDCTFGSGGGCFDNSDNDNGFPSLPGWDAVTGLGSPNYPKMKQMVDALPQ